MADMIKLHATENTRSCPECKFFLMLLDQHVPLPASQQLPEPGL
jgi:hypothetical protein